MIIWVPVVDKVRVLVVDDDPGIRVVIPRMLAALGPTVLTAETMSEAIVIMGEDPPPDFIFLDLGLPDTESKEATLHRLEEIRRFNPSAPVVVLTGDPDMKLEQVAATVGVDAYRRKAELTGQRDLWLAMKEAIGVHVKNGATPAEALTKILTAIANKMIEGGIAA